MPKIKDLPAHKRPREKLAEKGPEALADHELLAVILRSGYKGKSAVDIAKRILKTTGLKELSKKSLQEIIKIKGVGITGASILVASLELSKRVDQEKPMVEIKSPNDVLKVVSGLRNKKREYMVALYLNARSELIKKRVVSIGTLTESLVHPREVFAPAIKNHAVNIVLAHNHPSGSAEPSDEDVAVTQNLKEAGEILGIKIVDHVIVSKENYMSMREAGVI
jgi:DNA repair protein RadC